MKKNIISKKVAVGLFTILTHAAKFFKVSFIVGSHIAFFSASSVIMPLCGVFGGFFASFAVCALSIAFKLLCGGTALSFKYLAYHIPGLFAALYLASGSPLIRVLVPLACMAAFVVHPVGGAAWIYSLYWLVPVTLYFFKKQDFFFQALGSTLVAHAVGSVIWLYAEPMTSTIWLGLIPVVFVERMVYAIGMVGIYRVICVVIGKYKMWRGYSHDQTLGLHNGWQSPVGTP